MMQFDLQKQRSSSDYISGQCAKCEKTVWEALFTLDDAYNVWSGKCPYCGAINLLSVNHGLRGYSSSGMHLVLPTDEEKADPHNELPEDCPTSGPCGHKPNIHGSPLGEFLHQFKKQSR